MDSRKLMTILGIAAVLLFLLGILLMPGKKTDGKYSAGISHKDLQGSKQSSEKISSSNYRTGGSGSGYSGFSSSSRSGSGFSSGNSAHGFSGSTDNARLVPRRTYSEQEMQELRKKREERRKEIYEKKLKWVADQANNEKLSQKSRYQYRLKLIEGYRKGNDAFNKGDYAEAIKEYLNGIKDPDANAETKFSCLMQIQATSKMVKDYSLYLEVLKQQAQMIEEGNLEIFGMDKKSSGWPLYESRKRFVEAIQNPEKVDEIVDEIIKREALLIDKDKDEIKEKFLKDMNEFKNDFESTRESLKNWEDGA